MTQYVINIGALPNDGTGDPLRTAFNEVNLNFNQVWATGLVNSNIQIANNTILTTNTNGNLILNPNGVGSVIANAHVIPDQTRIRNLGSPTRYWDTLYAQYVNVGGNLAVTGDLSVTGNLTITGDIIEMGNIVTDAKTIQLANTATSANAANGSGITVGANDAIATFLYNSADNAWVTNVRFETGNLILTDDRIMDLSGPSITNADLISGPTSGLDIVPNGDANATVLYNTYGNIQIFTSSTGANVKVFTFTTNGTLLAPGAISAVGNITGNYIFGNGSQLTDIDANNINGLANVAYTGDYNDLINTPNFGNLTTDITTTGNITGNYIFGNGSQLTGINAITISNTAPVLGNGALWWNSVDGRAYIKYNSQFIDLSPSLIPDPTTYVGNVIFDNIDITNVGNIVPAANNVYSLGSPSFQWKDLYVSNTTIYMNNVPISLTAGNVLTVNGNDVVTTNANGQTTLGNLSVDDNNIYNTNGQGVVISNFSFIAESETAYVQIPAGNSASDLNVVQEQGNVRLVANTAVWTFDTNGIATLPDNTNMGTIEGANTFGFYNNNANTDFLIELGPTYAWSFNGSTGNFTAPGAINVGDMSIGELPGYITATANTGIILNVSGPDGGFVVDYIKEDGNANTSQGELAFSSETGNTTYRISLTDDAGDGFATKIWRFDGTGNITLPSGGNLVGATAYHNGYINWIGNSSGDGYGYTTMNLVPDNTVGDSYLILDPTSPSHIHIRAGGTQDNSGSQLFLGGENSYFKVDNGPNPNVYVGANSQVWTFGSSGPYGELTLPGEGIIRALDDTINLVSLNTTTGNANSVYLGSSGGLGFSDSEIGGNWLEIFRSGTEPQITVPVGRGNLTIQTAEGGNTYNWIYDNTGNLTLPGNTFQVNYANGTPVSLGGGSYGNADVATFLAAYGSNTISTSGNITAGNLIGNISITGNIQGTSANVSLVAGSYTATFDNTGYFTLPAIGGDEGGELHLAVPAANTTLQDTVKIDVYQDRIRFFEGSANAKGAYIDLANCANGVTTAIGYRDIPQITFSANATAAVSAAGCHYYSTTAGNLALTLPDNSSVAFPTGATLTIVVNAAGNVLVNQAAGVSLYQAGSSTTGNRVVGAYGLATVMKVAANTWVISGTGVY